MTKDTRAAIAEARRRWGPEGDAWGITPILRVGFWTSDVMAPLQIIQGEGKTWDDAFANAKEHKGHYHVCRNDHRRDTCSSGVILCYQDCGEVPKVGEQLRMIHAGTHGYLCSQCRKQGQKAA